ncbi:MAG: FtsX-like permease family protein [Deltaproteobacteria bacterium]|nr:FtsX-like permease family protein [Deltaproteobacteria bacterium]
MTNREFRGAILEAIDQIFSLALALEIITMMIAFIGIVNTLMASVIDRTREIGVVRSLGATKQQVGTIFFFQSGLLGLFGTSIGAVAGYGLGVLQVTRLNEVLAGWKMPVRIDETTVAIAFIGAVVFSVLGGLSPARAAANLTLRDALKYE